MSKHMLGYGLDTGEKTKGVDENYKLEEMDCEGMETKESEQLALDVVAEWAPTGLEGNIDSYGTSNA